MQSKFQKKQDMEQPKHECYELHTRNYHFTLVLYGDHNGGPFRFQQEYIVPTKNETDDILKWTMNGQGYWKPEGATFGPDRVTVLIPNLPWSLQSEGKLVSKKVLDASQISSIQGRMGYASCGKETVLSLEGEGFNAWRVGIFPPPPNELFEVGRGSKNG